MLLEAHYMQIDRTLNKLAELREYLDDTEDYINFQVMETYTLYLPEFYTCYYNRWKRLYISVLFSRWNSKHEHSFLMEHQRTYVQMGGERHCNIMRNLFRDYNLVRSVQKARWKLTTESD
uniref:Genomic DNA, chromosome 5, P1 clone: MTH16 n=1 Tax=Arabidopsis thaliana TaxID=3702 RepID=Q9FXX3_ARATH|nr:unnamed protein product [Arabidopsis thaliana]